VLAGEDVPRAPKQERSRRAREALLAAALALFAERGFEATSVEEIATRAGLAVGGFYSYFRSKRQALLVLMDRLLAELAALDLNVPPGTPPRAIVAGLVHAGLRVDWAYAGAYRAWHEVILRDAELAVRAREIEAWTLSRLRLVTGVLTAFPGARTDLDVERFCWVTNQLFWRMTETQIDDRAGVERMLADMLGHALFTDER
jgi:AcrR family transcriptional regulator